MHSVCCCSLPVWRRSFLKKGTPWPILSRKTTRLVRDHEYFIPTKFHQNPSSGDVEEVENGKVYGRRTDGRTTDGALWQKLTWAFGSGELKNADVSEYPPSTLHSRVASNLLFCAWPTLSFTAAHSGLWNTRTSVSRVSAGVTLLLAKQV